MSFTMVICGIKIPQEVTEERNAKRTFTNLESFGRVSFLKHEVNERKKSIASLKNKRKL